MAYTIATFTRLDVNADGSVVMVITHTGDSGEIPREQRIPYEATVQPTVDTIRAFAIDRNGVLNRTKNFVTGATPNIGAQLDIATPLPSLSASTFGAFVAASAPFTPGATPQDVFTITGSATRIVRVVRMGLSCLQTTAGMNSWQIVKRAAANTGGTSAPVTRVPLDDAYPAATATVLQYTANSTGGGTLIGAIWSGRIAAPAPATAVGNTDKVIDMALGNLATLTGTTDVLAWNFNGVALPTGLSLTPWVMWTEQ